MCTGPRLAACGAAWGHKQHHGTLIVRALGFAIDSWGCWGVDVAGVCVDVACVLQVHTSVLDCILGHARDSHVQLQGTSIVGALGVTLDS